MTKRESYFKRAGVKPTPMTGIHHNVVITGYGFPDNEEHDYLRIFVKFPNLVHEIHLLPGEKYEPFHAFLIRGIYNQLNMQVPNTPDLLEQLDAVIDKPLSVSVTRKQVPDANGEIKTRINLSFQPEHVKVAPVENIDESSFQ